MSTRQNHFLSHDSSDESESDGGYDSEAAEAVKGGRGRGTASERTQHTVKRRKLLHDSSEDGDDRTIQSAAEHKRQRRSKEEKVEKEKAKEKDKNKIQAYVQTAESRVERPSGDGVGRENEDEDVTTTITDASISTRPQDIIVKHKGGEGGDSGSGDGEDDDADDKDNNIDDFKIHSAADALGPLSPVRSSKSEKREKGKGGKETKAKAGVIYLSSLPPYLKPSALRNLLQQRGFGPIIRLFLTPASKARGARTKQRSTKNSRQLYSEGWIEFASRKTARRCAETLNASIIGGKKGGFYHDDLWNMKYLRGMGWDELMAGVREERREEEGRRDEERRMIARETRRFVEGVEEGRRVEGIKRKRETKMRDRDHDRGRPAEADGDLKRTWRQFEVKGTPFTDGGGRRQKGNGTTADKNISDDVKEVLGQIF